MQLELNQHAGSEARSADTQSTEALPANWPLRSWSRIVQSDGRGWHVQESGDGEPLLLLHGTGASTHSYRALMPLLAESYRVVAIDLPGHGFTERRQGEPLSLDAMCSAIAGLLERLDLKPRWVVGHSAGAAIALRMSLGRKLSAEAIVGLNPALLPFGGPWRRLISPVTRLMAAADLSSRMIAGMAKDPAAVRRMIASTGSHLDEEGNEFYRELLMRTPHAASILSMMANWELGGLVEELPQLDARLTLVTAERDSAVPPSQVHRVAESSPAIEVIEVRDAGHLLHEERPEFSAELLAEVFCPGGRSVENSDREI